jgi:hypothetical protein
MAVETPTVRGKSFEVPKSGLTAICANAVVKIAFARRAGRVRRGRFWF